MSDGVVAHIKPAPRPRQEAFRIGIPVPKMKSAEQLAAEEAAPKPARRHVAPELSRRMGEFVRYQQEPWSHGIPRQGQKNVQQRLF